MHTFRRFGWLLLLAGCSGASAQHAPTCREAVAQIRRLHADRGTAADPEGPDLDERCASRPWSERFRRCVVGARTRLEHAECARSERIARGDDLDGPSCEVVVSHVAESLYATRDDAPPTSDAYAWCRVRSRAWKECILAIPSSAETSTARTAYARCQAAELTTDAP